MDAEIRNFEASNTTVFFNTRDEMVKVKLDKVAYFEADSNYSHVVFVNGAKATLHCCDNVQGGNSCLWRYDGWRCV